MTVGLPATTTVTRVRVLQLGSSEVVRVETATLGTLTLDDALQLTVVRPSVPGGDQPSPDTPVRLGDLLDEDSPVAVALREAFGSGGLTKALGILWAGLATRIAMPCRLVFVGSSTTAGNNATAPANRYVNLLMGMIQAAYPSGLGTEASVLASASADFGTLSSALGVHGYNGGEGGTTSATYLTAAERTKIAALDPRMVQHMVGSNDFRNGVPVATYKANVLAAITDLKSKIAGPCVHVLVQPYQRFDSAALAAAVAPWSDYGKALADIAAADPNNVAYIDLSAAYAVVGIPGADPLDLIDTDGVHQTDAGHALMADLLRSGLGVVQVAAAAAAAPAAPVTPVQFLADEMIGAAGASIASRSGETGGWTLHPSTTGDIVTSGAGTAYRTGGTLSGRVMTAADAPSANYEVRARIKALTRLNAGIIGVGSRYSTTAPRSGYYVQYGDTSGVWTLSKVVADTSTTLATGPTLVLNAGDTAEVVLTVNGTTVSASVNGQSIGSVSDVSIGTAGRVLAFSSQTTASATTGLHFESITATTV